MLPTAASVSFVKLVSKVMVNGTVFESAPNCYSVSKGHIKVPRMPSTFSRFFSSAPKLRFGRLSPPPITAAAQ